MTEGISRALPTRNHEDLTNIFTDGKRESFEYSLRPVACQVLEIQTDKE